MGGKNPIASALATEKGNSSRSDNPRWPGFLRMGFTVLLILPYVAFVSSSWASGGETSEHFSKFLEIPLEGEGLPHILTFPLYEQKNVRYFSAGLGKEERSLSYPPYPLKLIFVKGDRAYLTNVAVEVFQSNRTQLLTIPEEEVEGPWLFLNLPAGKYIIKGTDSRGISQEKTVNLPAEGTTTVYFQWR